MNGIFFHSQEVSSDAPLDSANLPLEHRGAFVGPSGQYGPPGPQKDDPWPLSAPDMPQIKHLQVQCEKTHMRVNIEFDRPFYGMIFSKGDYLILFFFLWDFHVFTAHRK